VYCQVVYLRGCQPASLRNALSELPQTLDETYQRTLREIKDADWELAHRLFQCVAVASRPLRVDELAEFLAFEFKEDHVPGFNERRRSEDPLHGCYPHVRVCFPLSIKDGHKWLNSLTFR
jgi:hypothetical protein